MWHTLRHFLLCSMYFAGVEGFCEKNKDQLPNDIVDLVKGSKNNFFVTLFENVATDTPAVGKKGIRTKSLSLKFKEDLGTSLLPWEPSLSLIFEKI